MKNESIFEVTERELDRLAQVIDRVDWGSRDNYADWLAQTYYYVSHSTRLLCAAASRYYIDRDRLHIQSLEHCKEERSHEKIAISDLNKLGLSIEQFPEFPSTKALYQAAYYLIERRTPVSLYGYIYFLEYLSLKRGREIMSAAEKSFGSKAVEYLRVHTTEDDSHIKTYRDFLGKFKAEELAAIHEAVVCTADNYIRMIESIQAKSLLAKQAA